MKRSSRYSLLVLAAGVLVSLSFFFWFRQVLLENFRANFEATVSTRARIVQDNLEKTLLATQAVQRYMDTAPETPERGKFQAFASPFVPEDGGLRTIFWIPAVSLDKRARFEEEGRKDIRSDFRIFEYDPEQRPIPAADRDVSFPLLYAQPENRFSRPVLGFDVASNPRRLETLTRARDTGEPSTTGLVKLAGDSGTPGFTVFLPVYGKDKPPATVPERRASLKGFVLGVYHPDILMREAFKTTTPIGLPFELLDYSAPPENRLLFKWVARLQGEPTWKSALFSAPPEGNRRFAFGGREWGIRVTPNLGYMEQNHPLDHWLVLPACLLLTLLFAGYLHKEISKREELDACNRKLETEIAEHRRTELALRESEAKYRVVADNTYDWEFWYDPQGKHFLYVSPSCKQVSGHEAEEFLRDPSLLTRIIHPEDKELFARHRRDIEEAPHPSFLTFRIVHPDGSIRWIEHVCQPVKGADGAFRGTRGSNRDITGRKQMELERERLVNDLQDALANVKKLEGLLPICSNCKKIRDEGGEWSQMESFIRARTDADFSHGICPECMELLYPEFSAKTRD